MNPVQLYDNVEEEHQMDNGSLAFYSMFESSSPPSNVEAPHWSQCPNVLQAVELNYRGMSRKPTCDLETQSWSQWMPYFGDSELDTNGSSQSTSSLNADAPEFVPQKDQTQIPRQVKDSICEAEVLAGWGTTPYVVHDDTFYSEHNYPLVRTVHTSTQFVPDVHVLFRVESTRPFMFQLSECTITSELAGDASNASIGNLHTVCFPYGLPLFEVLDTMVWCTPIDTNDTQEMPEFFVVGEYLDLKVACHALPQTTQVPCAQTNHSMLWMHKGKVYDTHPTPCPITASSNSQEEEEEEDDDNSFTKIANMDVKTFLSLPLELREIGEEFITKPQSEFAQGVHDSVQSIADQVRALQDWERESSMIGYDDHKTVLQKFYDIYQPIMNDLQYIRAKFETNV